MKTQLLTPRLGHLFTTTGHVRYILWNIAGGQEK